MFRKHRYFGLALVLAFGGCSPERGDSVSSKKRNLETLVSAAFDIEAFPELFPATTGSNVPLTACGLSNCFEVHTQAVSFDWMLLGSRLTSLGEPLDLPRKVLAGPWSSGSPPSVTGIGARGTDFAAVWSGGGVVIDGTTGEATRGLDALAPGYGARIVGFEAGWLLFESSGGTRMRILSPQFEALREPVYLPVGAVPWQIAVESGPENTIIVWQGAAMRIDSSTGALIDTQPLEYSRYILGIPSVAYIGGSYVVAWTNSGNIYSARVRASDGALLDPDDEFNQISGARTFCDWCSKNPSLVGASGRVALEVFEGKLLLFWSDMPAALQPWNLHAAWLDPTTGLRVGGPTAGWDFALDPIESADFFLDRVGSDVVVQTGRQAQGYTVHTDPSGIDVHEQYSLVIRALDRHRPAAASNGSDFAVVWQSGGALFATRIDGTTGAYLDDPPLEVAPGREPAIAAIGNDYVIGWIADDNRMGRRVLDAAGTLGTVLEPLVTHENWHNPSNFENVDLKFTWNGKYIFATWLQNQTSGGDPLRGVRLDANGIQVGNSEYLFDGWRSHAVAADRTPPENMRTFMVANRRDSPPQLKMYRSETGILLEPPTNLSGNGQPYLASDGSSFLYAVESDGEVLATFIDPLNGSLSEYSTIFTFEGEMGLSGLWFDGKSYNLLIDSNYWNAPSYGFYIRRYQPDLTPLDAHVAGQGTPIVDGIHGTHSDHVVVSNLEGRSLVVTQRVDHQRMALALEGRFIDNDGMPTPEPPPAGGSSGVGGQK